MTDVKTINLTVWTSISKVMSELFNTLSRFVTASLPRSKCLLISWLQCFFNLVAFKIFPLPVILSNLIMMYLGLVLVLFLVLGID